MLPDLFFFKASLINRMLVNINWLSNVPILVHLLKKEEEKKKNRTTSDFEYVQMDS